MRSCCLKEVGSIGWSTTVTAKAYLGFGLQIPALDLVCIWLVEEGGGSGVGGDGILEGLEPSLVEVEMPDEGVGWAMVGDTISVWVELDVGGGACVGGSIGGVGWWNGKDVDVGGEPWGVIDGAVGSRKKMVKYTTLQVKAHP